MSITNSPATDSKTPPPAPGQVTQLLRAIETGSAQSDELLPIVYSELRKLAAARMAQEAAGQTLQPTALVHEAYLRLIGGEEDPIRWESRGHFFAAAAEAMRRILIDNARRKQRIKHGGARRRVDLHDADAIIEPDDHATLLALDAVLAEFARVSPEKAQLVKLRYFGGLSEQEAADVLGISRPTASRWWAYARAWLYDRLNESGDDSSMTDCT